MIFKNLRIRAGSDSIFAGQDWTRTEKFVSPLISAAQLPSNLLYSGNASKTTHDVTKLFTRQGKRPGCYSLAPLAFSFVCLFI